MRLSRRRAVFMKNILMLTLLGLTLSLTQEISAKKLERKEGAWSRDLQSMPKGVANPLITKAVEMALKAHPHDLMVIDIGAGTGRNITDLLEKGATVYAYDADPESIRIIQKQFAPFIKKEKLYVFQEYFEDISSLPKADMVIAWRSLPFMKKDDFPIFWKKMENALTTNGIFIGTFFGEENYTKHDSKKPKLFRLTHEEVLNLFTNFQIIHFQEEIEYDEEASRARHSDQFEHIYRVIAKKKISKL